MAVDIKHEIGKGVESVEEQGVMGADLLTGATAAAVQAVSNPVAAIRKLERKGAPINRALRTSAVRRAEVTGDAIQAYFPEQIVLGGLRLVKERARRKDLIGQIAFRALEVINDGLGAANTVVQRMERASAPPSRPAAKAPLQTSVRQSRTAVRKTVKTAGTKARSSVRRATAAARRTERKATSSTRTTARTTATRARRTAAA